MAHDNRSEGNRIDETFVYAYFRRYEGEKIVGAGFYRLDMHPDAAIGFGASEFSDWEVFNENESESETPDLFIIINNDASPNQFGL